MEGIKEAWALAETEELLGDSLFFTGEPGSAAHYRAAQLALVPPGVVFSSREENDRRMQAFQRVAAKLYGIGADGLARATEGYQAHPRYVPLPPKPELVAQQVNDEVAAVPVSSAPKTKRETELGRLLFRGDWWADYQLGAGWFEAAKILAADYPTEARAACEWSLEHYQQYAREWSAHLPASRWDSDGEQEIGEVNEAKNALRGETSASVPIPDWVRHLLAGDWRQSLAAFQRDSATDGFQLVAEILAEACKLAGESDAAQRIQQQLSKTD